MKAQLLKVLYVIFILFTFITTAKAQRYTSDTYGYACYNYFDNTNVTTTVSGTTTSSTSSSYSFSPDPTVAANNTSVVVSTSANLSVTTTTGAGLESKYQATPKGIAINNITASDAATYAPLNSNDWEWSFIYKSNLTGTTYPTSAPTNAAITSNTANSWRYWLHATTATISSATKGFYITQKSDGCLYVYVQNGSGTTAQLLKYSTPLTNGVAYCIKVQRLTGAYWNLYVDPYTTSVPQAQTLRAQTNSDNQSISLTYSNSVIEAENVSGKDGLFQFDEMHMYTRYCQFTGITSTANGVTPLPLYAGEGTVILYGEQIQMRGNYALGGQIYIGKSDSGYPEGNIAGGTLYYTPNSYFSTASPATVSTSALSIYSNAAQASNLSDNFTSAGNNDGTLTTLGYYFITTTVDAIVSFPTSTMTFNGSMTVYDNAKNNSPIVCVSTPPAVPTTITFGSLFDWKGGTATGGIYLWATGSNWVGGVAPSGSTDIARFGIYSTSYPYNQQPTLKANVSIGTVIVGTNIKTSSGANTGGSATFNLTSGSAGTTLSLGGGLIINAGANLSFNGYSSASRGSVNFTSGSNSSIASTGIISATNTTLTNTGTFTLFSDATGTATIGQLINSTFGGNINVQRYVTGGSSSYRGYRLFSSPVNVNSYTNLSSNLGYFGLSYLNAASGSDAILLAGPGYQSSGFNVYNPNPLLYLYDESRTSSNASYVAGKNVGITAITGSSGSPAYSVTTLSGSTTTSGVRIPVGNSFLLYYVGSESSYTINSSRVPDAATVTATGYINQGAVPVTFWNTSSTQIPYHTGTGGKLPGLNQVGNPYPSTISLDQVAADNPAISPQFWELDEPGGTYISYSVGGATSNARASKYIVSGQGFLVQALGTGETITFQEDQKVAYPSGFTTSSSPGALLLSIPPSTAIANFDNAISYASATPQGAIAPVLTGLHLQITRDSITNTETGIYFSSKNSDAYTPGEDAIDLDGTNPKVYLSSYSSDGSRLCINQLTDYAKGKKINLYAAASTTGLYTISLADIANIDTNNYNLFLVDKKMNDSLDMARYKSYAFNINTTDTTTYGANRFALSIQHKPVPLYALLQFSGAKVNTGVSLFWQTLNAGNYTGFVLQKLDGNGNYNTLYTTRSDNNSNYNYVDQHPVIGNNVYRLQQTDINNNITYSAPVTILYSATSPNGNLTVYPNPAKSIITVSLTTNVTASSADIYNTSGTLIKHEPINSNTFTEDISSYKLGIYIIELRTQNGDLAGQSKFIKVN